MEQRRSDDRLHGEAVHGSVELHGPQHAQEGGGVRGREEGLVVQPERLHGGGHEHIQQSRARSRLQHVLRAHRFCRLCCTLLTVLVVRNINALHIGEVEEK